MTATRITEPVRLPQELCDLILYELNDTDLALFHTCSLVCRSWVPACRRVIFRSISVEYNNFPKAVALNGILSSSRFISDYVRSLSVNFEGFGSEDDGSTEATPIHMAAVIARLLFRFKRLEWLEVNNLVGWALGSDPRMRKALVKVYELNPMLRDLVFRDANFPNGYAFPTLITDMGSPRPFGGLRFYSPGGDIELQRPVSSTRQRGCTLTISPVHEDFLDTLCAEKHQVYSMHAYSTLRICAGEEHTQDLLSVIGPALKTLHVWPPRARKMTNWRFHVEHNPGLRVLHVMCHDVRHLIHVAWIAEYIGRITSPTQLEEIIFDYALSPDPKGWKIEKNSGSKLVAWKNIEVKILNSKMDSLQRIKIRLLPAVSKPFALKVGDWMSVCWAELMCARGIEVTVEVLDAPPKFGPRP